VIEALRRLAKHERWLRDVLPELSDRLTAVESATARNPAPSGPAGDLMARLTAPRRRGMIPGEVTGREATAPPGAVVSDSWTDAGPHKH
jgi:hypothetical protein